MVLQLLVAAVAIGLSVAKAPPYKEHVQAIEQAAETLEKKLLSMEGNIPLLNDYRRHYAEIIYVIDYNGIYQSGCLRWPYYEVYYKNLNNSASVAISNPEKVITQVRNLIDEIHKNTTELKELIDNCVQDSELCNELIDDTVIDNPDQFGYPANLLIAAGEVATELNKLNEKFEEVSKDLKAHQYVCTTPEDFEQIVNKLAEVHRILRPPFPQCN